MLQKREKTQLHDTEQLPIIYASASGPQISFMRKKMQL